jgi:hypothetical protein
VEISNDNVIDGNDNANSRSIHPRVRYHKEDSDPSSRNLGGSDVVGVSFMIVTSR